MHAIICITDGITQDVVVLNTRAEAEYFRTELHGQHYYDRIDIKAISTASEVMETVKAENAAMGEEL